MRTHSIFLAALLLLPLRGHAEVRVFVEQDNGLARIGYENTAGEVIRAFALDVSVDQGEIVGISQFFRGESIPGNTGYGLFPASFRDSLTVSSGIAVDWDVPDYTPLANEADAPADTLPGLNSTGVTLEFGALWDPTLTAAIPEPTGTLCLLELTQPAQVSIQPNNARGGVTAAALDATLSTVFTGAWVDPTIEISGMILQDGTVTIQFHGGELEAATSLNGPWTGTGNTSGQFIETVESNTTRYYRVHRP